MDYIEKNEMSLISHITVSYTHLMTRSFTMIEIQGKCNFALCFCRELEKAAEGQIRAICDQEAFSDSKIRIMPDVHAGMGCTIGTTMTITDKVVPGMVGVDIGCGMETTALAETRLDFARLDALIRRDVYKRQPLSRPIVQNNNGEFQKRKKSL